MRSISHFYRKVQIFSHISKYVSNEKVENYMLYQYHKYRDFLGIFRTCILEDVEIIRDTILSVCATRPLYQEHGKSSD